jgi:hypothetical protein
LKKIEKEEEKEGWSVASSWCLPSKAVDYGY